MKSFSTTAPSPAPSPALLPLTSTLSLPCFGSTQINRAIVEFTAENGRHPTPLELTASTGLTLDHVQTCLRQRFFKVLSIDALLSTNTAGAPDSGGYGDRPSTLHDITSWGSLLWGPVSLQGGDPIEALRMQWDLREDLASALCRLLNERERHAIALRYGLGDGLPRTYQQTARVMGHHVNKVRRGR